jgi:hypothetical protein
MLVKTPDRSTPADRTRALEYCADKGKRPPKEFTSDICSRWPDGEWSSCCMEHDIKYWCGGSAGDRLAADKEVRACVNTIKPGMGNLMFWGTRLGGASWLPTSYRWGYGWPWPHTGK